MPAYNAERFVREAIDSVLGQALHNLALIVVDDGSTDDTLAIARSIADPRVHVLTSANRGPSHARNIGLAAPIASPFVAFIDADDTWDACKLAAQTAYLTANPDVVAVGCFMRYGSSTGRHLGTTGQVVAGRQNAKIGRGELFPFVLSSLVATRAALEETGGFDEVLGRHGAEDVDLYARLAKCGRIACLPEALGVYRIHPGGFSTVWAKRTAMAGRFVHQRLAERAGGGDLEWDEFEAGYQLTLSERRQDFARCAYRLAAVSVGEGRYIHALGHWLLALLASPYYTLPRLFRHRRAHMRARLDGLPLFRRRTP
jgi:GT2 family glycosyltransferase